MTVGLAVAVFDIGYIVVGLSWLRVFVSGARIRTTPFSAVGLSFLIGCFLVTLATTLLVLAGLRPTVGIQAGCAAVLFFSAALIAGRRRCVDGYQAVSTSWNADRYFSLGCRIAYTILLGGALLAAFHASPFLDDTVSTWVPRGLALQHFGFDPRLFTPNHVYRFFAHPDYPLLWSVISANPTLLTGHIDPRAALIESVVLVAAFIGAARFLLRPLLSQGLIDFCLMLLVFSPELMRETQSGGADVVLAVALASTALCGAIWLARGGALHGFLAWLFAATAMYSKSEGAPQVLLLALLFVLAAAIWRRSRVRWAVIWIGSLAVTFLPLELWRELHRVTSLSDISLSTALDPSYLARHTARLTPAARVLARHLLSPRQWMALVPISLVLALVAALRKGSRWLIIPAAWLVATFVFWLWVNWADSFSLAYRLGTSAYRVIMPMPFVAALTLPFALRSVYRAWAVRAWAFRQPPRRVLPQATETA